MAENGRDILEQSKFPVVMDQVIAQTIRQPPEIDFDKEARLRTVKDRQNEERQKKLEEIKAQALAAQRFKEQKEEERRRRMEELRVRDDTRRQQVEERKRAINDAERDRLESILRRNQEREQRIEAKRRNEKSNIVFAFGSSTPRMLDPTDLTVSFWGHRRATSIQNITCSTSSLTRRQSERDLDVGNKKRATSATGLERSGESSVPTVPAGCVSGYTGRRRTDLVPTIPSRDSSFSSSRKSLNHSPASSRPSSSLSQQSTNSVASSSVSVSRRPVTTPRRPRPASIAVTGITHDVKVTDKFADTKPPLPKTRKSVSKPHEKVPLKNKAKSPVDQLGTPKQLGTPQHVPSKVAGDETQQKPPDTPPIIQDKPVVEDRPLPKAEDTQPTINKEESKEIVPEPQETPTKELVVEKTPEPNTVIQEQKEPENVPETKPVEATVTLGIGEGEMVEDIKTEQVKALDTNTTVGEGETVGEITNLGVDGNEMTTSIAKVRINTEEEAKAALAERRRLIREEAERQAELERLRIEAEAKAELERQQKEEEQVRKLIELRKQAEEERLKEAIREAQKREEEERLKREEEQRLKLLKEEAEKKAREDAERQKAELQERLKNEEKEREARRKRVEAIMLRTRGRNNANLPSQQSMDDKNENKSEENKMNEENKLNVENALIEENKKNDDNKLKEENKVNGTKRVEQQENGMTKNGKDVDIVDNIISDEIVKNANTVTIETVNSTDAINSNSSWQDTQQYGNIVCNNNS